MLTEAEKKVFFESVYEAHYQHVFRICKGYFNGNVDLSNDAVQETFIRIWQSLDSFREEAKISTWVYRIAVNTCLLQLRKASFNREINTDQHQLVHHPLTQDNTEERLQQMYACINRLDEKSKVIILMVLEGIGYDEIASVAGLSAENLRVKIHRIKKTLTDCIHG